MYYKCPYCGKVLRNNKRDCRSCGAPASNIVTVYEEGGNNQKVIPASNVGPHDVKWYKLSNMSEQSMCIASLIGTFVGLCLSNVGVVMNLCVLIFSIMHIHVLLKRPIGIISFGISLIRVVISLIMVAFVFVMLKYFDM